jgi:hypothetical protein
LPRATVSTETHHRDLKTLPDGWVTLKQLSFDEMLERRDNALRMSMEQDRKSGKNAKQKINLDSASQWTRHFEFSRCIVDHNLEDDNGEKLNFANPMTLGVLDPKVGSEIERYIEELNQEDEESLEDFTRRLSSSSETNGTEPNESSATS